MWKKILSIYALLYIPVLLLSLFLYFNHRNRQIEILIDGQTKDASIKNDLFVNQCSALIHDVDYWSNITYPEEFEPNGKDASFIKPYVDIIKGITNYDQFRFINLTGKEIFRVERKGGNDLELGELQDKKERSYVKAGLKLKRGQIYVSKISLNREHGEIEIPYNPVLRVVAPIFDINKEKIGIVVVNFRMAKILALIKYQIVNNNISLIDSNNKIITSTLYDDDLPSEIPTQNIEDKAAFDIPDKIMNKDTTFMINKNIWTIKNVGIRNSILKDKRLSNNGLEIVTPTDWKLILQIPKEVFNDYLAIFFQSIVTFNIIAMVCLFAIAVILQKSRIQKEKYYTELETKNHDLENKRNLLLEKNRNITSMNERLEVRNKQLSEFNYLVSHNLKAPVASMSVIMDIIKNEEPENIPKLLPKLDQVTTSITDFTNDISNYVSLLDNKKIDIENITLSEVIDAIQNEFAATVLDQTDFDVLVNLKAWNQLLFSKLYLHSILQNLLSNAIKYRKEGVKSFILFETGMEQGIKVLYIKDNGLGINLERHSGNIFKLYKRFHRNISGKGIGLFLIKSQLEALNATIDIESQEGVGTTFKIKFKE